MLTNWRVLLSVGAICFYSPVYNKLLVKFMSETITIEKEEYLRLKHQAEIDMDFLKELVSSLFDIRTGRVTQVR